MCTVGFMNDSITVREPESGEVLQEVCVIRTGIIDRDLSLLVATQQRNDIELNQRAIGICIYVKMCTPYAEIGNVRMMCYGLGVHS